MNYRKFNATQIPGGRLEISTPLGKRVAEGERDADRICAEIESEMEKRLGRPPTRDECLYTPRPKDDRTPEQVAERKAWRPKRPTVDRLDVMADQLEPPNDPYYSVKDRNKRLATGLRGIAQRNRDTADADNHQQERLKRLAPDLKIIDGLIDEENWRCDRGSRRVTDLCEMWREQLVSGSDATESRRLRQEVMQLLGERETQERAANEAARAALLAELAKIPDSRKLATVGEDDPVRYRANQLMADGADPTSAWTQARSEAEQGEGV